MASHSMTEVQNNFAKLQQEWIQKRKANATDLFVDSEFPAQNQPSIVVDKWSENGSRLLQSLGAMKVRWERAPVIAGSHNCPPQMVVKDMTLFDLNQGNIGNCWYIAGVAHLAERPDLIKKIVPDDQGFDDQYGGIFHFNIWHFGEWVEVVIDDYLPCYEDKDGKLELFFIRNYRERGEFWSALLEKAYAKLYGSYEILVGGFSRDSSVDITGGVGFYKSLEGLKDVDDLYQQMSTWVRRDTLFGCGITHGGMEEERSDGLLALHAYTITELMEVTDSDDTKHRLIRLRNPHGDKGREWNGAWSDNDTTRWDTLTEECRASLPPYNPKDGEFWMSFEDFAKTFTLLEACFVPASSGFESFKKCGWNIHSFPRHAWLKQVTAGGSDNKWINPQFRFELKNDSDSDSTVYISLMKITSPWYLKASAERVTINFDLYRLNDSSDDRLTNENNTERAQHVAKGYDDVGFPFRELTKNIRLKPGRYCVVASPEQEGDEGRFLVRVATESGVQVLNASNDPVPDQLPVMDERPTSRPDMKQLLMRICCALCCFAATKCIGCLCKKK